MLRILIACAIITGLLLLIPAGEEAFAATRCEHRPGVGVLDILPDLALPLIAAAPRSRLRLSEGRSCTESCIGQCREAQRSCSGDAGSCRANFQICARRCVVTCGSR
jgi:hypothetical protein